VRNALPVEQDDAGLQIAVQDATLVRMMHRAGHALQLTHRRARVMLLGADALGEALTLDVLHAEELLPLGPARATRRGFIRRKLGTLQRRNVRRPMQLLARNARAFARSEERTLMLIAPGHYSRMLENRCNARQAWNQ
jgi:hypothetical protein